MKDLLISIIVPIYNAEIYIERCITSIQNQTYKNLQIVLVNDGSTDCSYDICRDYATKDNRITLVSQDNQGVVAARKTGVREAVGDFIGWVDADDWIEEDYVERLVNLQGDSGAEIVAVAHYHDIGESSSLVKNGIKSGVYETQDIISKILYTGSFFEYGIGPHLVTKLFDSKILKKTQLEVEGKIIAGDDAAVVYSSILEAKRICVSDIAGYHYIQNPGSLTKMSFGDEKTRVDALISFLENKFREKGVFDETKRQLDVYRNYLLALRQIEAFDEGEKDKLIPYGGISGKDRVIIYGAGVLGQKIYKYLKKEDINIVAWLDKNSETYQLNGYDVISPDELSGLSDKYDYILIANITERTAISIKKYLLNQAIDPDKIRWFTDEFCGKN